LPEHLTGHLMTMGELHRAGRYDRLADGVERVTGRPAMSVREFVSLHADAFRRSSILAHNPQPGASIRRRRHPAPRHGTIVWPLIRSSTFRAADSRARQGAFA